jgi:prepilin-type N-terminal cleavage/methylation domain-containing protein
MSGRGARLRQSGFTLTEVMMSVALLGIGFGFVVAIFMKHWELWKQSFDELMMQRAARQAVIQMTMALREASPGTVVIDSITGNPNYSRIAFTDGRGKPWSFWQKSGRIEGYGTNRTKAMGGTEISVTKFLAGDVATLTFIYPNFQDVTLIDVAVTCQKTPYARAVKPIVVQMVERVMLRNP